MKLLEQEGRWLKVRVKGRTGWVPRSKVDMADDGAIARNTRRRPFVDGRSRRRGFGGAEGPEDRIGADAVGEDGPADDRVEVALGHLADRLDVAGVLGDQGDDGGQRQQEDFRQSPVCTGLPEKQPHQHQVREPDEQVYQVSYPAPAQIRGFKFQVDIKYGRYFNNRHKQI